MFSEIFVMWALLEGGGGHLGTTGQHSYILLLTLYNIVTVRALLFLPRVAALWFLTLFLGADYTFQIFLIGVIIWMHKISFFLYQRFIGFHYSTIYIHIGYFICQADTIARATVAWPSPLLGSVPPVWVGVPTSWAAFLGPCWAPYPFVLHILCPPLD